MDNDLTPVKEERKDLDILRGVKDIAELIDKDNKFLQIFTRAADPNSTSLVEFHSVDEKSLTQIAERMPEMNRASRIFGKQNSQATGKLMSLSMIAQAPYRRLKQVLAKVERKRGALKENIFKLRKEKIELDRLIYKRDKINEYIENKRPSLEPYETEDGKKISDPNELEFMVQTLDIEIEEKVANMGDTGIYIEGALKEIGAYQDAYDQIMKTYDIPEDWDEEDFEKCEVEEHVKTAFLHAVRDITMTGKLNVGTCEYLEQFGVNPLTAKNLVEAYISKNSGQESEDGKLHLSDIGSLYQFQDEMYNIFKNEYKKSAKRIGLDEVISGDFLYKEGKEPADEDTASEFVHRDTVL